MTSMFDELKRNEWRRKTSGTFLIIYILKFFTWNRLLSYLNCSILELWTTRSTIMIAKKHHTLTQNLELPRRFFNYLRQPAFHVCLCYYQYSPSIKKNKIISAHPAHSFTLPLNPRLERFDSIELAVSLHSLSLFSYFSFNIVNW